MPSINNGENLFWAGGCASCHAADGAVEEAKLLLSGGHVLKSQFGDFIAPNISTSKKAGIGNWSLEEFANAMVMGVSPRGKHYYPAFPYASYAKMTLSDVSDLYSFMQTLPESEVASLETELAFPFNIRRGVGLWKKLYVRQSNVIAPEPQMSDAQWLRGQYLVEGPGHCGECHTPRTLAGGMDMSRWLQGAPTPDAKGNIPGITNADADLYSWSAEEIAYALESGFTPEFDSLGSTMADVVLNYAKVKADDREAIAAYLKSLN
ncbi:MAG: cytochrome c [Ahrensia sp.]|nr:cytochrome c [Ahrensia sp.]